MSLETDQNLQLGKVVVVWTNISIEQAISAEGFNISVNIKPL